MENKETDFTLIEDSPPKKKLVIALHISALEITFSQVTIDAGTPKIGYINDIHTPIVCSKSLTYGFSKLIKQ